MTGQLSPTDQQILLHKAQQQQFILGIIGGVNVPLPYFLYAYMMELTAFAGFGVRSKSNRESAVF